MAINFPSSPALNQEYTFGTKTWVWNGTAWALKQNQPTVLLDMIKTVDGAGSGLDADVLDGSHASAFYLASNPDGYTNNLGTVTSIVAGTGLTGGTITGSGTIALDDTGVTAGSYTASNITVDAQGRITSASSGSAGSGISSINFVQFPISGTYTPPSNLVYAEVTMVGAGGGGGGSDSGSTTSAVAAGGGSGGNGARKLYSKASLGSSVSVVIGAAGAGGTLTGTNGSSGGTTSFGSDSVSGGRGGNGILTTNGVGFETSPTNQTPPTNSMFIAGGNGRQGIALVYASTNYVAGGAGGNTILSLASGQGATRVGTTAGSTAGNPPPNYAPGSGGGGAVSVNTITGAAGGAGAPGFVLIKEYLS